MKEKIRIISVMVVSAVVLSLLITSCKKDKDEVVEEVKQEIIGSMTATIGSESWTAAAPVGSIVSNKLIISGIGNKKSISLSVNGTSAADYLININPVNGPVTTNLASYFANIDSASVVTYSGNYTAVDGKITISSITDSGNRVNGSFQFNAKNTQLSTIAISGQFTNIKFIQ